MRRSGLPSLLLAAALAGCWPYGFAGGGLPENIRTVAIVPFENQTSSADLPAELYDALRREMAGRLGVRFAPEGKADAVVRGTITRYDTDIPASYSANPNQAVSARRRLEIAIDISIVDQTSGRTLWERKNLTADGEYAERAELEGRRQAVGKLVNSVIEGAQSQW